MTLPTQNAVPSSAKNDQLFNAEKIDQVVNSDDLQYTDRFGKKRFTFSGLYNVIQTWLSGLAGNTGASAIGTTNGLNIQKIFDGWISYAELRAFEPTSDNQIISLNTPVSLVSGASYSYGTGGRFYYDKTDTTSVDDGWGCVVTPNGARWKRVLENSILNLSWMGVKPGDDLSDVLQSAITFVTNYMKKNGFYGRPIIAINAGTYVTSKTIQMPSSIGLVCFGNVRIDGSGIITDTGYILKIQNTESAISASFWTGDNISAIGGMLQLVGTSRNGTGVSGIFVGNETTGNDPCRNVSLSNVCVTNCQNALTFGSIDTYGFAGNSLRLEQNWINLNSPNSTSSNSGERMSFYNTTFGGANKDHIYINTPGMDVSYQNCSFDFTNGDVLEIGSTGSYFSQKFFACHFEGWDGYLVNAPVNASNRSIMLTDSTILPRPRSTGSTTIVNSPSRQLFNGTAFNISMSGVDLRHEFPAYTEDVFMTPDNQNLSIVNYVKDAFFQCPSPAHILNVGYDFSLETVGTAITNTSAVLAKFKVSSIGGMTGSVTARSDGKGNQISFNATVAGSYVTLISTDFLPTLPGERLCVYGSIQALDSVGNKMITPFVYWYDKDGNAISNKQGNAVNMSQIFSNTSLPNNADGGNRYIASTMSPFRAPAGAAFCKVALTLSSFTGNVNLSRIVIFRLAG